MRRSATTSRAALLALCAMVFATAIAAPADAKRHRRHGHQRRHQVARSHQTALAVCPATNDVPTAATAAAAQASTLCLVNNERFKRGLGTLVDDARLDRAAAAHSADMVAGQYFDHTSPAGSTLLSRVRQSGYLGSGRARMAGENIAWATGPFATPDSVVRAWMSSPEHRANILRANFREVGTGVSPGVPSFGLTDTGATYTQDFGGTP